VNGNNDASSTPSDEVTPYLINNNKVTQKGMDDWVTTLVQNEVPPSNSVIRGCDLSEEESSQKLEELVEV
jgi:hypothetical protein